MLMKRYVMRRKHLPDMLQVYYEICDAEVLKCNKDNRPSRFVFGVQWCF